MVLHHPFSYLLISLFYEIIISLRQTMHFCWEFQTVIFSISVSLLFTAIILRLEFTYLSLVCISCRGKCMRWWKPHNLSENILSFLSMINPAYDWCTTTGRSSSRLHTKTVHSGPVRGKECSSWRTKYLVQKHHRASSCKFRKVSSSRTCQQITRALLGLCWLSGHTSVWVSSGDSFLVLGHPGIWTMASYSMARIMRPWCRTFSWDGWTWITGSFIPAWSPNLRSGLRILKEVSLGWTVWKHDIQWTFLAIYGINLCRFGQIPFFWNILQVDSSLAVHFLSALLLLSTSCRWCSLCRVDVVQSESFAVR